MKLPRPLPPSIRACPIAPDRSGRGFARSFAISALSSLAMQLAACGGGSSELPPVLPPQSPIARLWIPLLAAPATALPFDASDSQSPGGELTHYLIDYGDGSATVDQASPLATHTYANEGVYAVQLTVVDLEGNSQVASGELTIRLDPPTCSAAADCDPGDRCDTVCFEEIGGSEQ